MVVNVTTLRGLTGLLYITSVDIYDEVTGMELMVDDPETGLREATRQELEYTQSVYAPEIADAGIEFAEKSYQQWSTVDG